MVNTLGGVEVCLSEPAKEKDSGIDLEAGRQTIKGAQALAFVRQRKGLPNGDIDRIGRQQQFIGAIVRKTLSAGTLLNPFKLNSVLNVATDALQVDDDTSIDDLRDLAVRFRTFTAGGVIFSTVPIADVNGYRDRQSVVLLDETKMARAVRPAAPRRRPRHPRGGARPSPPREPLIVAPERIRVRVYNGAGVTGLGPAGLRRARDRRLPARRRARQPGQRGRPDDRLPRPRPRRLRPHRRRRDPRLAHRARPGAHRHARGRRRVVVRRRQGRQRHAHGSRSRPPTEDGGDAVRGPAPSRPPRRTPARPDGLDGRPRGPPRPRPAAADAAGRRRPGGAVRRDHRQLGRQVGQPARRRPRRARPRRAAAAAALADRRPAARRRRDRRDGRRRRRAGRARRLRGRLRRTPTGRRPRSAPGSTRSSPCPARRSAPGCRRSRRARSTTPRDVPTYADHWGGPVPSRLDVETGAGVLPPLPELDVGRDDRVLVAVPPADPAGLAATARRAAPGRGAGARAGPRRASTSARVVAQEGVTASLGVEVPGTRSLVTL